MRAFFWEARMRVIETHMFDGDVIRRFEHETTPEQLKARMDEPLEPGVIASFTILDDQAEDDRTEPAKPVMTVIARRKSAKSAKN
jgi:hypothetical protein